MKLWYNPALKTDKDSYVHALTRNVHYPGVMNYSSKAGTIELAFERTNSPAFVTLAAGLNVDNSGDGYMNASSAMLALAYAMPVNYNETYLALGFQGNYSFNKVGYSGNYYSFPDDFDKYGALGWSLRRDPYQSGYNFGYFTVNAGTALFHNGEEQQWYIGASARYINHPYTEGTYTISLPTTYGMQAGYTFPVNAQAKLSVYGNASWQTGSTNNVQEAFIGIYSTRTVNVGDSSSFDITYGVGVSVKEAVEPNMGFQFGQHLLAVYYEFNKLGKLLGYYRRNALDLTYRYTF